MSEPPFDWTREHSAWGRGDKSYVTHYELNAILMPIEGKIRVLYEKVERNEDRLMEVRAKHFAADIISSAWAKFIVIVLAVLTAFLLTNIIHVPNPFG